MKNALIIGIVTSLFGLPALANPERKAGVGVNTETKEPKDPTRDEESTSFDRESIKDAQKSLKEQGHEVSVSGKMDESTRSALKDFQKSQGLKTTGELNAETMAALDSAKSSNKSKPAE